MFRDQHDPERVVSVAVRRWQASSGEDQLDLVAVEEPLEVRLGAMPVAVIMRTPGHDVELAVGFLHTEGIVTRAADIVRIGLWRDADGAFAENVVTVHARDGLAVTSDRQRVFYTASSCGMCGKASIEAAMKLAPPLERLHTIQQTLLYDLPERLRAAQSVFDRTGGLHAAALFDLSGRLIAVREDVGRHNAVDKLIGRAFLDGDLPLDDRILLVSGRVSYEIVQKALVARIPQIAAISAPSSLAVRTARICNIALVGFLRDGRLNVY